MQLSRFFFCFGRFKNVPMFYNHLSLTWISLVKQSLNRQDLEGVAGQGASWWRSAFNSRKSRWWMGGLKLPFERVAWNATRTLWASPHDCDSSSCRSSVSTALPQGNRGAWSTQANEKEEVTIPHTAGDHLCRASAKRFFEFWVFFFLLLLKSI